MEAITIYPARIVVTMDPSQPEVEAIAVSEGRVLAAGTLDECNGRFSVTPEFPAGTYAYFLTTEWPVVPRQFRGTPTQVRGPGGPGGPAATPHL